MAALKKQTGLRSGQKNLNNTSVDIDKNDNLERQLANTEEQTQVLLAELANYGNVFDDPLVEKDETRNPIQKLLNLDKNTGLFGGFLEIINRPAEALQGAVVAGMNQQSAKNESLLENVWAGISGNKHFNFKDIGLELGNPFLDAIAGVGFEMFVDPLAFISTTPKVMGAGKKVFETAKNASAVFFAKTPEGLAGYNKIRDILSSTGSSFKKVFNTWQDPSMKIASNIVSNQSAALTRSKEQLANISAPLLEIPAELGNSIIKNFSELGTGQMQEVRDALQLPNNWMPTQEAQKISKIEFNSDKQKEALSKATPEVRKEFVDTANLGSKYLANVVESDFAHSGNMGQMLDKLTINSEPQIETLPTGKKVFIREDAWIESAIKTEKSLKSSNAWKLLENLLSKKIESTGRKIVKSKVANAVDEIPLDSLIGFDEGVGRYLYNTDGSKIPTEIGGGFKTTVSSQGFQIFLTDTGKSLLKSYINDIRGAIYSKKILEDTGSRESKLLVNLLTKGELEFPLAELESVQVMISSLQGLYKKVFNKDLNFVTKNTKDGNLSMKLTPTDEIGLGFEKYTLNDKVLNTINDTLVNSTKGIYKSISKYDKNLLKIKKQSVIVREMEASIDLILQDPNMLALATGALAQVGKEHQLKNYVSLSDDKSFQDFVNISMDLGAPADSTPAPNIGSVMDLNRQFDLIDFGTSTINSKSKKYSLSFTELSKGVSTSSFSMTYDFSKFSIKEAVNYVAYLRQKGIINDDTLKTLGINTWKDMNNFAKLKEGFTNKVFPTEVNVKVAPLTRAMDTSNAFINLTQYFDLELEGFQTITKSMITEKIEIISSGILKGTLFTSENLEGMYKYFSIRETKQKLFSTLAELEVPGIEQLGLMYQESLLALNNLLKENGDISAVINNGNIEARVSEVMDGLKIVDNPMNLINETLLDIKTNGELGTILSNKEKIDILEKELIKKQEDFKQAWKQRDATLLSLKSSNHLLYSFLIKAKNVTGDYLNSNIITQFNSKRRFAGVLKNGKNSWSLVDKNDLKIYENSKSFIPATTIEINNIKNSFLLPNYSMWLKEQIAATNLQMFESNYKLLYTLNMENGIIPTKLHKAFDLKTIQDLKAQNFAKATNGVIMDLSIANIEYKTIQVNEKIKNIKENLTRTEKNIASTDAKKITLNKNFESNLEKAETALNKLEEKITNYKEKLEVAGKKELKQKNKIYTKAYTQQTISYNKVIEKRNAIDYSEEKIKDKTFSNSIRLLEKDIKQLTEKIEKRKVKVSSKKGNLEKNKLELKELKSDLRDRNAVLKGIIPQHSKNLEILNAKRNSKDALTKKSSEMIEKRNKLVGDKKDDIKNIIKEEKVLSKLIQYKTALKTDIKKLKSDYSSNLKALNQINIENKKNKEIWKQELKDSKLDSAQTKMKNTKWYYEKNDYETKENILKSMIDNKVTPLMEQLNKKMYSPIATFYNPLNNASPQNVFDEYLAGQRHNLTLVADLLVPNKKNLAVSKAEIKSALPIMFTSIVENFTNIQTAVYSSLRKNMRDITGYDMEQINVKGYMRHVLDTDPLYVQSILGKSSMKEGNDVANVVYGDNAKKLLLAREYIGSADDINKTLGTDLFNTNPIQAMAISLDMSSTVFQKYSSFQAIIDNKLITTLDPKPNQFNAESTLEKVANNLKVVERQIERSKIPKPVLLDKKLELQNNIKIIEDYKAAVRANDKIIKERNNTEAKKEYEQSKADQVSIIRDAEYELAGLELNSPTYKEDKLALKETISEAEDKIALLKVKRDLTKPSPEKLIELNKKWEINNKIVIDNTQKIINIEGRYLKSKQDWIDKNPLFNRAKNEYMLLDDKIIKQLETYSEFFHAFGDDGTTAVSNFSDLLTEIKDSGQGIIHKGVFEMLKNFGGVSSPRKSMELLEFLNKTITPLWKKFALSSVMYHGNNWGTNILNAYLFGLPVPQLTKLVGQQVTNINRFHKSIEKLNRILSTGLWRTADEQTDLMKMLFHETDDTIRNAYFDSYNLYKNPEVVNSDTVQVPAKIARQEPEINKYAAIFEEIRNTRHDKIESDIITDYFDLLSKGIIGNNQINKNVVDAFDLVAKRAKGRMVEGKWKPSGVGGKVTDKMNKFFESTFNFSKLTDDAFKIASYKLIQSLDYEKDAKLFNQLADMGFVKKEIQDDGSWKVIQNQVHDSNGDWVTKPELDAEAATKFFAFDYNNLAYTENNILKTIFPFYTFTRKSVEFHMKNIMQNDKKYRNLSKAFRGWRTGFVDDDEQYDYQEGYIPVFKKDGEVTYLKLQLPWDNVDNVFDGSAMVNSLSPIFKTPLEMITGFDFFTGREVTDPGNFGLGLGLNNIFRTGEVMADMLFDNYAPTWEDKRLAGIIGKKLIDFTQIGMNVFSNADLTNNDNIMRTISGIFPSVFSQQNLNVIKYQNALIRKQRLESALNNYKKDSWKNRLLRP